jgi:hypothetical protein
VINVKIVGLPGTIPTYLLIGSGVLQDPIPTMWGSLWLALPLRLFGSLGPIPPEGIKVISGTLPGSVPHFYPMQALVGDVLTNLTEVHLN